MGASRGLHVERRVSREEGSFPGTVQTNRILRMSRSMQNLKLPVAQVENLAVHQQDINMLARRKGAHLRLITRHNHAQAGGMVVVAMR